MGVSLMCLDIDPAYFCQRDINLRSMLYDDIYTEAPNVELFVCSIPDLQRPKFAEAIKGEFRPAKVGEVFGPSWSTHWFRIHVTVPEKHASAERVEMHFDIGKLRPPKATLSALKDKIQAAKV